MTTARSTAITGAQIFDGDQILDDDTVVVRDGIIVDIGSGLAPPSGVDVVDAKGGTLLPGLIDAHAHPYIEDLERAIVFGVTTVLDLSCDPETVIPMKDLAASRDDVADLRSSSWMATASGSAMGRLGGQMAGLQTVGRVEDADAFVEARIAEGADFVKIFIEDDRFLRQRTHGEPDPRLFPRELVRACIDASHRRGLKIVAHVDSGAVTRMFVEEGGDGLAHVINDFTTDPKFVESMTTSGAFAIPTLRLSATFAVEFAAELDELRRRLFEHPRIGPYFDPRIKEIVREPATTAIARSIRTIDVVLEGEYMFDYPSAVRATKALYDAGVPLLAGTDAPGGIPDRNHPFFGITGAIYGHGIGVHEETALLVEAGLTPQSALTAATAGPARCFDLSDRGRIAEGATADLLLVDGDPTTDISALQEIAGIWRRGTRLDREAYRTRLQSVAA